MKTVDEMHIRLMRLLAGSAHLCNFDKAAKAAKVAWLAVNPL